MTSILCRAAASSAILLTVVGCAAPAAPAADPNFVDVLIRDFAFSPDPLTISAGQTVRWTNLDTVVSHTATSGDPGDADAGALFDSGLLAPGDSFTHAFDTPGEFVYFCIPHQDVASMRGARVIVAP